MSHFTTLLKRVAFVTVAGAIGLTAMAQDSGGNNDAPVNRVFSSGVHLSPDAGAMNTQIVQRRPRRAAGMANLDAPRSISPLSKSVAAAAAGRLPVMAGSVTTAESWPYDNPPIGMYSLPGAPGESFKLLGEGPDATGGGVAIDGKYYCVNYYTLGGYAIANVYCYDMETWQQLSKGDGQTGLIATDVALDPTTGTVYGFFYNDDMTGYEFGTVNYESYIRTMICPLTRTMVAIAIDADGTIYGIDREMERDNDGIPRTKSASLYKVDRETGDLTLIGKTGQYPYYVSPATIDPATGRMFWAVSTSDGSYLCEVDKTTGAAKQIMQFPDNEEVSGLYVEAPAAVAGAPAAVENLEAVFPEGRLNGRVSFRAPVTTFSGDPMSGALTYTVTVNGAEAATGSTTAGATVNAEVTVEAAGRYDVAAYVTNSTGDGPKNKMKVFIGHGVPSMPVITATYADNNFHISWEPVTTTVDGGYIDPDKVVYDIMRMPDEQLLAHDLTQTYYDMHYPEPTDLETYYFLVGARHAGNTDIQSQTGVSNLVVLGTLSAPYEQKFHYYEDLNGYTIIDGNKDGKMWSWYNEKVYMPYSKETACDDWFILPPMRLEGGRTYSFAIDAYAGYAAYPERFEVKYGKSNTAEAMTETVIAPTVITNIVANTFNGTITPAESGIYYIGVHGISDRDMYSLYVSSLSIGSGVADEAPASVVDFKVVPEADGGHGVDISFTAPDKTFGGTPLGSLTDITLTRNGRRVKVWENPVKGQTYTYRDERSQSGYYSYEITAGNEHGKSATVTQRVYVGVNLPGSPTDITLAETSPGVVSLTWKAPQYDVDGLPLNPDLVTYTIVQATNHDEFIIAEGLKDTNWSGRVIEDGRQDFIYFAVVAETEAGYSTSYATTRLTAIGTPAAYPFLESFGNGEFSMDFGISGNGGSWATYSDGSGFPSVEEDNGYLGMKGEYMQARSGIYTGKISLEGATAPVLSFYTYNIPPESAVDGHDTNRIEVVVTDDEKSVTVKDFIIGEEFGDKYGWNKVSVPLTEFVGKKYIQFTLITTTGNCIFTFFDRLRLGEPVSDNLMAGSLTAPDRVKAGDEYTARVSVFNDGDKAAEGYKVQLLCNGDELDVVDGPKLLSGDKAAVTFTCPTGPTSDEKLALAAKVIYGADLVDGDNMSNEAEVKVIYPNLPAPGTLQARSADGGVKLDWTAPDMSLAEPAATEDDFESYTPYANSGVGSWVFVDRDKGGIGGIMEFQIPGIDRGSEQSYWVMSSDVYNNRTFAAHSGKQYLCQMYSAIQMSPVQCDDWAITPELYGKKQEISFFARSYVSSAPETFEVYYSTGSVNPDDFIYLDIVENASSAWTEYHFTVPDGARRFAVRCISMAKFMFFMDDFSYIAAGSELNLEHEGYNLYRDDVKVASLGANELSTVDIPATEAAYRYRLTAVYNRGESRPTNVAEVDFSLGISDAVAGTPIVAGYDGRLEVRNADGLDVTVYAIDGKMLHAGKGNVSLPLAAGVYTVRVAGASYKVLVK